MGSADGRSLGEWLRLQEDSPEPYRGMVHLTTPCGVDQTVSAAAIGWIDDRHVHGHQKGTDGRSAGYCGMTVTPVTEPEPEAGQ